MSDYQAIFEFLAIASLPIAAVLVLARTRVSFGVVAVAAVLASAGVAMYSAVRTAPESDLGGTGAVVGGAIEGIVLCALSLTLGAVVYVLTRRE